MSPERIESDSPVRSRSWVDPRGRLFGKASLIDLVILAFGLSWFPMGYYVYKALTEWEHEVSQVIPHKFRSDEPSRIAIRGKNFRKGFALQIGDRLVPQVFFDSSSQLQAAIPKGFLPPGEYDLLVINNRGLKVYWDDRKVSFVIEPEIREVSPRSFPFDKGAQLRILGSYFDPSAQVRLGQSLLKEVTYISPQELRARVGAFEFSPARYNLSVSNDYGFTAEKQDLIQITDPWIVTDLLIRLDRKRLERLERRGPVDRPWEDGNEIGIIKLFDLPAIPKGWLMVSAAICTEAVNSPGKRSYLLRPYDQLSRKGSSIRFVLNGQDIEGVVLSDATFLSDAWHARGRSP